MQAASSFWFFGSHASIQLSCADNADSLSVILFSATKDHAPPVHVHRDEDEVFHVLDGEVRFQVGGETTTATAGRTVHGPKGVPHGFRVVSDAAKLLVITRGGFEGLVRAAGEPALADSPPPPAEPTPGRQAALAALCAAHRIDLLAPPIP